MALENLTPQEQQRAAAAGEPPPGGYPSWAVYRHEQILSWRNEHGEDGAPLVDGGLVAWLTLKTFPILLAVAAAFVFAGWIVEHSAGYRDLLEALLPSDVISTTVGVDGKPVVAGGLIGGALAVAVVVLTILRRWFCRSWAQRGRSRVVLFSITFLLTAARTAVLVVAPALILAAVGIANARDLEEGAQAGPAGLFPYLISLVPIVWFSIGSTRRMLWKTLRWRIAVFEAMDDGGPPGAVEGQIGAF